MPSSESEDEASPSSPPRAGPSTRRSLTVRSQTLGSDDDDDGSSRRKRAHSRRDEDEDEMEDEDDEDEDATPPAPVRRCTREPTAVEEDEGEDEDVYDPEQSIEERRELAKKLREQQRALIENPDKFLDDDPTLLLEYFRNSDKSFRQIKQTNLAAIESKGLLMAADLSAKRITRQTVGKAGGLDVDEFVSKCITYMTMGRGIEGDEAPELSSTQRHRRTARRSAIGVGSGDEAEADEEDDGDLYNWAHLGRYSCVPRIKRPSVPGFLLGPLSVEKKVRRITKRAAPLKFNKLKEVRPQELNAADLERTEKTDLTAVCKRIYHALDQAKQRAEDAAETDLNELAEEIGGEPSSEQTLLVLDRHALREDGGIDLMRFVINPRSFSQTVENMFYVSFLIKEGSVKLEFDDYGLPSIAPIEREKQVDEEGNARKSRAVRHSAVMSIDIPTWQDLIEAFGIKESMIEHRQDQVQSGPGARSWYS